jgi:hypothetical protein
VGCGIVFKLSPPAKKGHAWSYEVLHRFNDGLPQQAIGDGENPAAGVILDSQGTVYGTTLRAAQGEGTVFTLTPPTKLGAPWRETLLHLFGDSHNDGWNPLGLILGKNGDIYGPASRLGANGAGAIFRLRPARNGRPLVYTVLYNFMPPPDGVGPVGTLIFDSSANLYGVTQQGGTGPCQQGACGTVFELTP